MRRQGLPPFFARGREGARYRVCILRGNRPRLRRCSSSRCRRRRRSRSRCRRYGVYSSGVIPRKIWRRAARYSLVRKGSRGLKRFGPLFLASRPDRRNLPDRGVISAYRENEQVVFPESSRSLVASYSSFFLCFSLSFPLFSLFCRAIGLAFRLRKLSIFLPPNIAVRLPCGVSRRFRRFIARE